MSVGLGMTCSRPPNPQNLGNWWQRGALIVVSHACAPQRETGLTPHVHGSPRLGVKLISEQQHLELPRRVNTGLQAELNGTFDCVTCTLRFLII